MTATNNNPAQTCTYIGKDADYTQLAPTCCSPTVAGRSYCEQHLWQIYQKGTAVHRRKDARRAAAVWDLESELNRALEELEEEGEI